jgi:hypothetical protein
MLINFSKITLLDKYSMSLSIMSSSIDGGDLVEIAAVVSLVLDNTHASYELYLCAK